MIDLESPNTLAMLMMLKNQYQSSLHKKDSSDVSDSSSGEEDYRTNSKSLQKFFVGLSEDFTCSICYELFEKPIVLPCSHNFCKGCLVSMVGSHSSFSCPLCRKDIHLTNKGIDGLQVNTFLVQTIEKIKQANAFVPKFCDDCTSKKVSRKCETCTILLCKRCESNHISKNSSHKTVSTDSFNTDFNIETHLEKESDLDPPIYIQFTISRSQCVTLFQNWISSLWFAPSDLKANHSIRYIKPIYIPYWMYEAHTTTKYGAQFSTSTISPSSSALLQSTHSKFDNMTWSHKVNIVSNRYRYATISNTKLIDKDLLAQVQSWEVSNIPSVEQALPPNPKVQALAFLVDETTGWKKVAESKIKQKDREVCERRIKAGSGVNGIAKDIFIETSISRVASQKVFLPVYFVKYIYNSNSYTVIVNAQNSKIVGHRPYAQGLSTMLRMFKPNSN